jgi:MarR family 2-MHQ and catechol resistance regulon transcriptional repressor
MGTHYQGTSTERLALDTYIKLSRAAEAVTARINRHLGDYHLTVSQFGVLEALYHLGPMQVGQLGEKILKSSGNMTLVVDNLVKQGLAARQRRQDDRRCIDVLLTPAGKTLVQQILPSHINHVVTSLNKLTPEEQNRLAALCRKLGRAQFEDQTIY